MYIFQALQQVATAEPSSSSSSSAPSEEHLRPREVRPASLYLCICNFRVCSSSLGQMRTQDILEHLPAQAHRCCFLSNSCARCISSPSICKRNYIQSKKSCCIACRLQLHSHSLEQFESTESSSYQHSKFRHKNHHSQSSDEFSSHLRHNHNLLLTLCLCMRTTLMCNSIPFQMHM